MSINPLLPKELLALRVRLVPENDEGGLSWGFLPGRRFADLARVVNDFPTTTLPINVSASAGWISQLAGITNVAVQVASGSGFIEEIGVNKVDATGACSEGNEWISLGQTAQLVSGVPGVFGKGYFARNVSSGNRAAFTFLGPAQQLTTVETVDAAVLAQRVVIQEHSLLTQLRRLRKLEDGWDGETAVRISEATGNTAEALIGQLLQVSLSSLAIPNARLGPLSDGSLRFECTYSNKELFLTIADKTIEAQKWQPLDSVESLGYWETNVQGVREYLEWLVK